MENESRIEQRLTGMEDQLREIFKLVNEPVEKMSLMQLRVSAYRKIRSAHEKVERLLEIIETEFITESESPGDSASLIFLNKQQEEQHNGDLHEIAEVLREIRWILISPPENYQNVTKDITKTGT